MKVDKFPLQSLISLGDQRRDGENTASPEVFSSTATKPIPLDYFGHGLATTIAVNAIDDLRASDVVPVPFENYARGGKGGAGGGGGGGSGGGSGSVTYYSAGGGAEGYDILIEFSGTGWTTETADLSLAFKHAADYLVKVITGDIGPGGTANNQAFDDLFISASLQAIDGSGGVLGRAGPSTVWSSNELTATGSMEFDSADALSYSYQSLWDDIVMHEMMHVLGFGSLWNFGDNPLVASRSEYIGSAGLAAYRDVNGSANFIPVETDGGRGTAGAHWDEETLDDELMTGYINNGNYLSEFSVMSLADLGYAVTYDGYVNL